MKLPLIKKKIIETLKEAKKITSKDIERAENLRQEQGIRFFDALVKLNLVSEKELMTLLSSQCGIPCLDLSKFKIKKELADLIPEKVARRYTVVPISSIGKQITLAMYDPFNMFAIDDIGMLTQFKVNIAICTEKEVLQAIDELYRQDVDVADIVKKAAESGMTDDAEPDSSHDVDSSGDSHSAPIVRMVDLILMEAYKKGASDIHIEPYEERIRVRYRVDGHLREALTVPKKNQNALLARIKILANMDITENRVPQDGRFKIRFGVRDVDYRVSALPVYYGTKIVMRALDRSNLKLGLNTVGFSPENLERFSAAVKKPFGMIIITGPTGSGKSTTLYSILSEINTSDRNIITVEDPIEYQVPGITQMQTRPEIGFTFAAGLRAILRQSPDVVMLGEIRDQETADIAVKAALTGQIVLSTLHTNDAPSAITRLIDLGIEPFLLSPSLLMLIAQRLVRKLCQNCKEPFDPPASVRERFRLSEGQYFRAKGCEKCRNTGYMGRIGIFEVLRVDDRVREIITRGGSQDDVKKTAKERGMKSLSESGLEKAAVGLTTLEEVFSVTFGEL